MKQWIEELGKFYKNRIYVLLLCLTAVAGYGFKIVHPAIGIDDTPFALYFEEGLSVVVGRWVLFLLNKVVHISDFAPFLTDFAAVFLLMAAVTVWSLLFSSVLKDKAPFFGYLFFACIFLSCPLISEVFTYYLHNGIAIGYLSCGISLCMLREALARLEKGWKGNEKSVIMPAVCSLAAMVAAMGCYESFMVVWLVGALLLFLTERLAGERTSVFKRLCVVGILAVLGMVLRSVLINVLVGVFRLGYLREVAGQRSLGEMFKWMFEPGASAEFAMVLKRIFVMYGVFAYAYYPIKIFVLAAVVIVLFCVWRSFAQKDVWIAVLMAGSFFVAFLLVVIEGKATYYRSAQFLPLMCGYGALLLSCFVGENGIKFLRGKVGKALFVLTMSVILWNQCEDLNKWFYVDYRKYEYAKDFTAQIAWELEKNYDISKPVMFAGTWKNPKSLIADAYVDYGSETFHKMKRVTDMVDEHLLDKFYREDGVWVAQTPALSVIDWGRYAFDGDEELTRFFALHGHSLVPYREFERYEEVEKIAADMPVFPQKGSIADMGDYIVIHL